MERKCGFEVSRGGWKVRAKSIVARAWGLRMFALVTMFRRRWFPEERKSRHERTAIAKISHERGAAGPANRHHALMAESGKRT